MAVLLRPKVAPMMKVLFVLVIVREEAREIVYSGRRGWLAQFKMCKIKPLR